MEAPLWQPAGAGTGTNRYLYSAAAVLALVVVAVVLNSMGAIRFPWQQSPPEQVTAKQAPTPGARSDAARADFMINTVLGPQLTTLGDSVAVVRGSCPAGMTASCEDGLVEVDNNVTAILPVIDHQTVPACIAPQIVQLRADLVKLDAGAQLGAKGFKDNRAAEVSSGASQVSSVFGRVQADNAAAAAAAKGCDTQLVGP